MSFSGCNLDILIVFVLEFRFVLIVDVCTCTAGAHCIVKIVVIYLNPITIKQHTLLIKTQNHFTASWVVVTVPPLGFLKLLQKIVAFIILIG